MSNVTNYTLLVDSLLNCIAAVIYGYIGYRLGKRRIHFTETRLAWTFFIVWWYGLAASTFCGAVRNALGALGVLDLPLYLTITYVNLPATSLALFGLTYYLLYLFTGSRKLLVPVAIFYSLLYTFVIYEISVHNPIGIEVGRFQISVQYEHAPSASLLWLLVALLLIPQITGSLAYFSLYFRVEDTTQKYRILLVSGGIILWFSRPLLPALFRLGQQEWWPIATVLIGLGAASAILFAYQPPEWVKQRYNLSSIVEEPG